MRQLLSNIGVTVLPDQLAVAKAGDGLTDESHQQKLDAICQRLIATTKMFDGGRPEKS